MPGFVAALQPSITAPIALTNLYICFFVGIFISATVHCSLHFVFSVGNVKQFMLNSSSSRRLMAEYQERWGGEESTDFVSDIDKSGSVVECGSGGFPIMSSWYLYNFSLKHQNVNHTHLLYNPLHLSNRFQFCMKLLL